MALLIPTRNDSLVLLSVLMVLFFLYSIPTTMAIRVMTVTNNANEGISIASVCAQAKIPKFCIKSLEDDPRTKTADLVGLVNVSIDLAKHNATRAYSYIEYILLPVVPDDQKQQLQKCDHDYELVLGNLKTAAAALDSKNKKAVIEAADSAASYVNECENAYRAHPETEQPLSENNFYTVNLANVISAVALHLP